MQYLRILSTNFTFLDSIVLTLRGKKLALIVDSYHTLLAISILLFRGPQVYQPVTCKPHKIKSLLYYSCEVWWLNVLTRALWL